MFIARAVYGLTHVIVAALCSCSLQKDLQRWPADLYEAGRSVLVLMKQSKIPRTEPNTVHLYQHYSLFMTNKLQYTWRGDYCECVRPAQLPRLNRSSSSVPPGTISTICSPPGPRRIQHMNIKYSSPVKLRWRGLSCSCNATSDLIIQYVYIYRVFQKELYNFESV